MEKPQNSSGGGVDFIGLLTLLFIALKLTGLIDWSWWWVFSPIWISVLLVIGLFIIDCLIFGGRK